jgi:hypothetical protein
MPPARGATRMWDAALRVGGRQVFAEVFGGRVELRQAAYVYLLGWVTPPSLGGELTDLGMRAVKDGWWVDPPPEVQQQVRLRQEEAFNDLQAWVDRQQRNLIENEQAVDAALMPPPPPRPPPAPSVSFASPLRLPICPLDVTSLLSGMQCYPEGLLQGRRHRQAYQCPFTEQKERTGTRPYRPVPGSSVH